jgi:hypothetical protein
MNNSQGLVHRLPGEMSIALVILEEKKAQEKTRMRLPH